MWAPACIAAEQERRCPDDTALEHRQVAPGIGGVFRQQEATAGFNAAGDHQVLEQAKILDLKTGGITLAAAAG